MTSANVSQIPNGILMNTQAKSAAKSEGNSTDFMSMVNQSLQYNQSSIETSEAVKSPQNTDTMKSYQSSGTPAEKIPTETGTSLKKSPEEREDVVKATEEFVKDVVKTISEEMDVSEEEIENAAEVLGLSLMDLTDPNNIAKLLGELTGEENNVSLLLDDTVSNILSEIEPMIEDLFNNVGVDSSKELQSLFTQNDLEVSGFEILETPINLGPNGEVFGAVDLKEEGLPNQILNSDQVIHTVESESMPMQEITEVETTVIAEAPLVTQQETPKDDSLENFDIPKELTGESNEDSVSVIVPKNDTKDGANQDFNQSQTFNGNNEMAFKEHTVVSDTSVTAGSTIQSEPNVTFTQTVQEVQTSYTSLNAEDIMEQIVTQTRTLVGETSTTMELELHPASLGKMYLQVTENEGTISAKLFTENHDVKAAMETQMVALKETWNQQGLKVNSVEISVGTREFEEQLDNQAQTTFENGSNSFGKAPDEENTSSSSRMRNLNLNSLDELPEDLSEEEVLAASMMKDSGNSVNFTA
ncbi:MAG: flagellar hook-length control protein FliK [Lachnospiraceae bacterium]|nr:flagellar hook-length control protein FliK [Lachnospiraceae bacterium]